MEYIALFKKVTPSFRSSRELVLYVYSDSFDQAKEIVHKFYIEHYVLDSIYEPLSK